MQIVLNGQMHEIDRNATVAALLDHAGYATRRVAVEVNREIVPKSEHPVRQLHEGDQVEVVHALGGG
jgi:sulfur carrier protein